MLYALRHPLALLALLGGFLLAVLVRGVVQAVVVRALARPRVGVEVRQRLRPDPRVHLDPFGAVTAVLSGGGWGRPAPVEAVAGRWVYGGARGGVAWRTAAALLSGPVACLVLGAGLAGAFRAAGGPPDSLTLAPSDILHGDGVATLGAGPQVLLCLAAAVLATGVLALVPVPPLDGGVLLLTLAPTSVGWQRARQYAEQNWGVLVLLVLLLLPLGGRPPLLLVLVDAVAGPLLRLFSG